jgi:hypothetical protein
VQIRTCHPSLPFGQGLSLYDAYSKLLLGWALDAKIPGQDFGFEGSISGPRMLGSHLVGQTGFSSTKCQIYLTPMENFERTNEDNVTHYMIQKRNAA